MKQKSSNRVNDLSKTRKKAYRKLAQKNWTRVKKIMMFQRFLDYAHYKMDQFNQEKLLGTYNSGAFSEKHEKKPYFQIRYDNKIKCWFDFVVAAVNFYLSFTIPYRIAFLYENQIYDIYVHDLVLDCLLFLDIILRFFVSFHSETGLVTDPKAIFIKTISKFRFYTDVISIIPLYMLNYQFYWLKLGRIARAPSLIIWFNESPAPKKFLRAHLLKDHYSHEIFFKILYFCLLVAVSCHCIACLWYLIPTKETTPMADSWLGPSYVNYSHTDDYMRSLYWTAVTVSSVGYGDITPKTLPEIIYTMFVEFFGIMLFAFLMGNVSSYLNKYYQKKEDLNIRENELQKWLISLENQRTDKKLSIEVTNKIKTFFAQKWACDPTSVHNFEDFFMMLPPDLAEKLNLHLFSNRLILFKTFFDYFPKELELTIASMLFPIHYKNNENIIKENEKTNKIYFIVTGSVKVGKLKTGYALKLTPGSHFGEDAAIFNDESNLSFKANEETNCLYLDYPKLCKLFKRSKFNIYPFAKICLKRNEYFIAVWKHKFKVDGDQENDCITLEDIKQNIDIFSTELTFEQQDIFDARAKNIITFQENKKKFEEETNVNSAMLKKEIQAHSTQMKTFQETYEKELKKLIDSFEEIKNGKSVKKVIKKLNAE